MTRMHLVPAAMLSMAIVGGIAGGTIALQGEATPKPSQVTELRPVVEVEPELVPATEPTPEPTAAPSSKPARKTEPAELPEMIYQGGPQTTAPREVEASPQPAEREPAKPEPKPAPVAAPTASPEPPRPTPEPIPFEDLPVCERPGAKCEATP